MSSDDRRFGRPANPAQENEVDGEDEFGDFEGFEGAGLDSIPAAAGPSPWATFPDLLPVQTSPAATGNDEPGSSQMARGAESHDHEPWLNVASSTCQRASTEMLPNVAHDGTHGHFSQPRTINPPDVSLSAYQPTYNSIGEQSGASGLSHAQGGEEFPPDIGSQLTLLQSQVDTLTQQKHHLQQQFDQLATEKQQLQHQLANSQAESMHLRAQVVDLQHQFALLASSNKSADSQETVPMLQQIQNSLTQMNDTHATETNCLREAVTEMRASVDEKTTALENQLSELGKKLEQQQFHHVEASSGQLESLVSNVVRDCFKQILDSLSQTVTSSLSDAIQSQVSQNQDGVLQHFRVELQRHVDQTRRLLERERQQNLRSLAQALQAALKQFSVALDPTVNDHNEASGDEKS